MNTLIKITVIIATALLLLFSTSSCMLDNFNGIKGSRNVVSEKRSISNDIKSIRVQQGIQLHLTQGNSAELIVEADDNIIDLLKTEVSKGELKLYFEKNVYKAKAKNVYLTTEVIEAIRTSSGASVKSDGTIQANILTLKSSSGSSIKIDVVADEINSETSSGADIDIFGKTNTIMATSSSGSSIDADQLEANNAVAKVSSGSNIQLNVNNNLSAKASSGGHINFEGSPKKIDKETSSGGSVRGS